MKTLFTSVIFTILFSFSIRAFSKTFYVSPTGQSGNSGTSFSNPKDFKSALALVVAGDSILLLGGKYIIANPSSSAVNSIVFNKSGQSGKMIYVVSYINARAVFDFSFPEKAWYQDSYGFYVTGNYWNFKGIDIIRAGYQGAYVTGSNNTFENCSFHDNRNSGLEINEGGAYTTVINCDAYRNYDPKKLGSMADGFAPKQTQGPGNKFIGCRAWENSDDGYDCFDSPQVVTFENCWAIRNGVDIWKYGGFTGNGNGFKVGGNYKVANIKLTNCVSIGHPKKGFDQNNNAGGITIYNCVSYLNAANYGLGGSLNSGQMHTIRNNISLGTTTNTIANATQSNNSWNTGFSASTSDFLSLDTALARIARNLDGSIPETQLLRLKSSSTQLIDKGINVGLPYNGTAPDLGCFETGNIITKPPVVSITFPLGNTVFTAPAVINFEASASDADGTISKVEFYNGSLLIGKDDSFPYSYTWSNVGAGTFVITAKATDNNGSVSTSSPLTLKVNDLPGTIQAEAACVFNGVFENKNAGFEGEGYVNLDNAAGTAITWSVNSPIKQTVILNVRYASTTDRNMSLSVNGTMQVPILNLPSTGAFTVWNTSTVSITLVAGTNKLTAISITSDGGPNLDKLTFSSNAIREGSCSQVPTVSIQSPADNEMIVDPSQIIINVMAEDVDGGISKVDLYIGTTLLQTDASAPYTFTWMGAAPGTYTLTAVATDNSGAFTTSNAVSITIPIATSVKSGNTKSAIVYPNPSNETFMIEWYGDVQNVYVINVYGEKVDEPAVIGKNSQAEVGRNLPAGIYVLILEYADERSELLKIVKGK